MTTRNSYLIFLSPLQATNKCVIKNKVEVEVLGVNWRNVSSIMCGCIVISIFLYFDAYVDLLSTSFCEYI